MPQSKQIFPKPIESSVNKIIRGDALTILRNLRSESVDCVITSPPYWSLRDYGVREQIGLESTAEEYLEKLLAVFAEIRRVLKSAGTCWVLLGDTYAGKIKRPYRNKPQNNKSNLPTREKMFSEPRTELNIPPKSLCMIPSRFAIGMIERGWILRNEIIWHKPNATPQSVKDRFTVDFEKMYFFVKARKYYFNRQFEPLKNPARAKRPVFKPGRKYKYDSVEWSPVKKESLESSRAGMLKNGRNRRSVWTIGTANFSENHFAVYPPRLIETPIKAGCPAGGIVLDPFMGSGTTAVVAKKLKREFIGIELNPEHVKLARNRIKNIK